MEEHRGCYHLTNHQYQGKTLTKKYESTVIYRARKSFKRTKIEGAFPYKFVGSLWSWVFTTQGSCVFIVWSKEPIPIVGSLEGDFLNCECAFETIYLAMFNNFARFAMWGQTKRPFFANNQLRKCQFISFQRNGHKYLSKQGHGPQILKRV